MRVNSQIRLNRIDYKNSVNQTHSFSASFEVENGAIYNIVCYAFGTNGGASGPHTTILQASNTESIGPIFGSSLFGSGIYYLVFNGIFEATTTTTSVTCTPHTSNNSVVFYMGIDILKIEYTN